MPDLARYCRDLETYLCQKNSGHLVRIVGPAFEQVCSWAERGVPLKIAFRGIDRYCERYNAKGDRRRPVRIEFCEADILDAFGEWRRAVGVGGGGQPAGDESAERAGRKPGLATHIERALVRLRSLSASRTLSRGFLEQVEDVIQALDSVLDDAPKARGDARLRIIERLRTLDTILLSAATAEVHPEQAAELRTEAESELAPFGSRLSPEARDRAVQAAFGRLVRDALAVPALEYE
jgi:hypothetical protein